MGIYDLLCGYCKEKIGLGVLGHKLTIQPFSADCVCCSECCSWFCACHEEEFFSHGYVLTPGADGLRRFAVCPVCVLRTMQTGVRWRRVHAGYCKHDDAHEAAVSLGNKGTAQRVVPVAVYPDTYPIRKAITAGPGPK